MALSLGGGRYRGLHDLPKTLETITDGAPVVLMAHEPDIFPEVPDNVGLTVSGHTHGGQIRFAGRPWVVPSKYGTRYAYGVTKTQNRTLVVSGGLGCSGPPFRVNMPPEITMVTVQNM